MTKMESFDGLHFRKDIWDSEVNLGHNNNTPPLSIIRVPQITPEYSHWFSSSGPGNHILYSHGWLWALIRPFLVRPECLKGWLVVCNVYSNSFQIVFAFAKTSFNLISPCSFLSWGSLLNFILRKEKQTR